MTHKDFVISKVEKLIKMMEDAYKDSEDYLLAPEWIEVNDILMTARKNDRLNPDTLHRLNYIYRKTLAYKDKKMSYEDWVRWNILDILAHGKNSRKDAIYYIMGNMLHENGTRYLLSDAEEYVDNINENGTKVDE